MNPSDARDHIAMVERIIAASSRKLEAGGEFFVAWGLAGAIMDVVLTLVLEHRLPVAAMWINAVVLVLAVAFTIIRSRFYRKTVESISLLQREYFNVLMLAIALGFVTELIGYNLFSTHAVMAMWNVVEALVLFYIGLHGNRRAQIGGIALIISIALANFNMNYSGFILAAGVLVGYGGFGVADLLARE